MISRYVVVQKFLDASFILVSEITAILKFVYRWPVRNPHHNRSISQLILFAYVQILMVNKKVVLSNV
jgi:hypothetical protein